MDRIKKTRSAGGFIFNPANEVLLVQEFDQYWGLPRGHIEEGETALLAAKREIKEESGITDLMRIADLGSYTRSTYDNNGKPNYKEMKHITYFAFRTEQFTYLPHDKDITDIGWFEVDDAKNMLINKQDVAFFIKSIHYLSKMSLI
jgi:8-oxo-dGTP pyrophosphatase MutT (NUDIX family)